MNISQMYYKIITTLLFLRGEDGGRTSCSVKLTVPVYPELRQILDMSTMVSVQG